MQRVLTVKGQGNVSEPPDWIIISLDLVARNDSYEKTMEKAGEQLKQLRNSLAEEGFGKEDIKTTSFDIDTEYERIKNSKGQENRKFSGYKCRQSLYIGFQAEAKKLSRVLKSLAVCPAKAVFSIRYSLKNEQKVKEKLLQDAVRDAFTKAAVLAEAGQVKLRDIVCIDYDWSEVRFESSRYLALERYDSYSLREESLDFQPDDIEARDTVSVVWEIE